MTPKRNTKRLIIAIDGPAGSGKSSTAKALAIRLGLPFIDTGAMYRAITLKAMQQHIPFDQKKRLVQLAKDSRIRLTKIKGGVQKVYMDGKDVTHAIREPELTQNVFHIAQEPGIRREMVKKQRMMGKADGAVMEGRDIGTKVFPHAHFKFFFRASSRVRASRRLTEFQKAGQKSTLKKVLADMKARDKTDTSRKEGPLRRAKNAILVDTSALTISQTVDKIMGLMSLGPKKGSGKRS